jgi:hypothetical protein
LHFAQWCPEVEQLAQRAGAGKTSPTVTANSTAERTQDVGWSATRTIATILAGRPEWSIGFVVAYISRRALAPGFEPLIAKIQPLWEAFTWQNAQTAGKSCHKKLRKDRSPPREQGPFVPTLPFVIH